MSGHGNRDLTGLRFSLGQAFFGFVWQPEGILLTPRCSSAQYGYGFPKRDVSTGALINPPYGTKILAEDDECLNQVLINRFPNNKYLDREGFIQGLDASIKIPKENDRLRNYVGSPKKNTSLPWVSWPLFYTPEDSAGFWSLDENQVDWIDLPGANQWSGGLKFAPKKKPTLDTNGNIVPPILHRQFDASGTSLIYEEEFNEWFCHWPEELLYNNDAFEQIFFITNLYRSDVGLGAVHREIRGFANLSRMVLSEMQRAHVQYHDYPAYRSGYTTLNDRFANAGVNATLGAENLISGVSGKNSEATGLQAIVGWRNSPPHYGAIVYADWDVPKNSVSLNVFGGVTASITDSGPPTTDSFAEPLPGTSFSEIFVQRSQWLYAGTTYQDTIYGRSSTFSHRSPIGHPFPTDSAFVCYQGRELFIDPMIPLQAANDYFCNLGSCVYLAGTEKRIRVILAYKADTDATWTIISYYKPLTGIHKDWLIEVEDTTVLEDVGGFASTFSFNSTGTHGVVSATKRVFNYGSLYLPQSSPSVLPFYFSQVVFQFDGSSFSLLEEVVGPDFQYDVEENSYLDLTRYHQYGSTAATDGLLLYPMYNELDVLVRLKQRVTFDCDQTTDLVDDHANYLSIHEILFPSGTSYILQNLHHVDGILVDANYFSIVLYLDVVKEQIVYARFDLTQEPDGFGSNTFLHGTLRIYFNTILIKEYPSQFISPSLYLTHPAWSASSYPHTASQFAKGVYHTSHERAFLDGNYFIFPPWTSAGAITSHYVCNDEPSILYPDKLLTGAYPATLGERLEQRINCYSQVKSGQNAFADGYNISLPLLANDDNANCYVAAYRDRVIVQVKVESLWGFTPATNDQVTIYANFPLETELGLSGLTDVYPLGVV